MVTPNHPRRAARALTSRPMPSGAAAGAARPLGRRAGNIVLACALSLSLVPSIAFAEEAETAEGESIELVAETAAATEPTTESAPTAKTEAPEKKTEEVKVAEKPESSDKVDRTEAAQQPTTKTEPTAAPTATETPETPEAKPADATPAAGETASPTSLDLSSVREGVTYRVAVTALTSTMGDSVGFIKPGGDAHYAYIKKVGEAYSLSFSFTGYPGPMSSITCNGQTAPVAEPYDFTFAFDDIPSQISLTVAVMGRDFPATMTLDPDTLEVAPADKTALKTAIDEAKSLRQEQKSEEAWKALQEAIATAETAYNNPRILQQGVDAVTATLRDAMKAFNESENVGGADQPTPEQPGGSDSEQTPKPPVQAEDGAGATPGGFYLVKDKAYPVKASTTSSMINQMSLLSEDATVVWNGSAYVVTIGFQGTLASALKGITYEGKQAQALGNNRFSFEASDIAKGFHLAFNLGSPAPEMTVEGDIMLDTTSLPTESGKPIESEKPTPKPEGSSNQNANNSGAANNSSTKAEKFQVGHTYRVPIAFTKQGGSATSMAAKYFGDTALVRPRANGTFDVTFAATSEGLKYINALKYKGTNLKRSGNQFTVNIPAASGDTTVPIVMDISMLRDLGLGDAVTADMHLYLNRAEDLGTGKDSAQASSNAMLAQTSDAEDATGLALAALAAGAVAVACRRRLGAE